MVPQVGPPLPPILIFILLQPHQETCALKFTNARMVKKPLRTEWCLDEDEEDTPDIPDYTDSPDTPDTPDNTDTPDTPQYTPDIPNTLAPEQPPDSYTAVRVADLR